MSNKHFIPPIIEQWIQNMNNPNSTEFVRGNYEKYLRYTRDQIDIALLNLNKKQKKVSK